jgi:hypothetical protein
MANWRRHCSSWLVPPDRPRRASRPLLLALLACVGACGHAAVPAPAAPDSAAADPLCRPAEEGSLVARLQGAIDADLDWGPQTTHCLGGVRPSGDGLRLLYKGAAPDGGPLTVVIGAAPLQPGESARNVPVNLTVVREGTGQFFATQGEDKCAFDEVRQTPVTGTPDRYRLEGRGYCTQPARAVGGDGAVLLSRFDVVAVVDAADHGPAAASADATKRGAAVDHGRPQP